MLKIATEFTQLGYKYKQIKIDKRKKWRDSIAVYEKVDLEHNDTTYEVIVIKIRPETVMFGNYVEERESYPSSESWGVLGHSFTTLPTTLEFYDTLLHKVPPTPQKPIK